MKKIIFHIFLPLLLGGIIYFVFKEQNLLIYTWLQDAGLADMASSLKGLKRQIDLPIWVKHHLADGFWAYSITASVLIFSENWGIPAIILVILSLLFCISYEVAQYFDIVRGVYDWRDVLISILFSLAASYLLLRNER